MNSSQSSFGPRRNYSDLHRRLSAVLNKSESLKPSRSFAQRDSHGGTAFLKCAILDQHVFKLLPQFPVSFAVPVATVIQLQLHRQPTDAVADRRFQL